MAHNSSYSEDTGYVNIHGKDVRVLVCEKTGRILIPIDELKGMGFRLFRKSQYSRLLIDENQFSKEFAMFMLASAQTYMLENKTVFSQNDVLDCINKCKSTLTGSSPEVKSPPKLQTQARSPLSNFARNHVVHSTDDDIKITTNLRHPMSTSPQNASRSYQNGSPAGSVKNENIIKSRDFGATKNENTKPRDFRSSFGQRPQENGNARPNSCDNFPRRSLYDENSHNEQPAEKIETIKLDKKQHDVIVSFVEKPNCAWVQDFERSEMLIEIDTKVNEEIKKKGKTVQRPVLNKVFLATDEGLWFRCKVIKFKPLTVFFLDYGNTAQVSELIEASKELSEIPGQAARITFLESQGPLNANQNITIQINKTYENGTYGVKILHSEPKEEIAPPVQKVRIPPTFFTKPRPLCALENGQRVLVLSHSAGKLALRTKECHDKIKQIEAALETENSLAKPVESVKTGQLVILVKDKPQRGVVLNISRDEVEVDLLDYYDKVSVHLSKLRYISESLAKEAVTFIVTPTVKNYSNSDEILKELVEKKAKGTVVLANGEFDLNLGDVLLSDKLKPKKVCDRPMITDFEVYKPKLGKGSYTLNHFVSKDELYMVGPEFDQNLETLIKELDGEDGPGDDAPYKPILGEVCAGMYAGTWCRCVVLGGNAPKFEVNFIDFGNTEMLECDNLRKLPEDMKSVGALAFPCKLTGLPAVEDVDKILEEIFPIAETYNVEIKKHLGDRYEVEVPALKEKLEDTF